MKVSLYGDLSYFWQWDLNRKLVVEDDGVCSQVHFCNGTGPALVCLVRDENGLRVADVPNILLQKAEPIKAYLYTNAEDGTRTRRFYRFDVLARAKPEEYIYTETEVLNYAYLDERISQIEQNGISDEKIGQAVADYLDKNGIETGATEEEAAQIQQNKTDIDQLTQDKLDASKLPEAVNEALAQAKASGEFKGEPGYTPQKGIDYFDGEPGEPGKTPEKGKDYFTDAEKQEIAEQAAKLVEIPEEDVDLTGYATEEWVSDGYQPKGEYLTEVPDGYAKTEDIPTKPEDIGAQPVGNYLTEVPSGFATEEFVKNKIAEAELGGEEVDLSGYAQKSELPIKVSQLQNDSGFITEYTETDPTVPSWAKAEKKPSYTASEVGALPNTTKIPSKTSDLTNDSGFITGYTETDPTVPAWAKNPTKPSYTKSEVGLGNVDNVKQYSASNPPPYPVTSVNGKTGAVTLDASAVGARPASWMPSASDVGALPASTTIPTKVSQLTNDKGYLTQHQDISGKLDSSELPTAINTALAQAKVSGEFDGKNGTSATHSWNGTVLTVTSASGTSSADLKGAKGDSIKGDPGQRGTGLLSVTTAPSSYTTAVGGITPKYRMAISTIKSQAGVTEVLLGDTIRYSYYQYPIEYLDASYAYCTTRVSLRGTTGKTAYQYAQDGGYAGTEAEFAEKLAGEYTLNPLHGKKVSFIGDSICAGGSDTYVGGYGKIIADRNNMVYENLAQAGSTITAETYSSTTGDAKGWISRMVESMSADADYAIVEGGINDAWQYSDHKNIEIGELTTGYNATLDDTTYYGAFESMLKQLVTKFQGKKIGYIAIPKTMSLYDSNRNAPNFYHIALECCAKWGVPVCDLNTIIPPTEYLKTLGTEYTADGTHPTYEGYLKYYCDPIEAWMKTLTTGASVSAGAVPSDLDDKYVSKNDISIKKAQLTLEDGTTVLIDVVVASAGTTIQSYTNQVIHSVGADKVTIFGSDYNGDGKNDGYLKNYRLSASSGSEKSDIADASITGFIKVKPGDIVRFQYNGNNICWDQYTQNTGYNVIAYYKGDGTWLGSICPIQGNSVYGICKAADTSTGSVQNGGIVSFTVPANDSIEWLRLSFAISKNGDVGLADLIVTVNEEIT